MDPFLLIVRIVHIFAGVFWVRAALTFIAFVEPTAKALGPDSQRFMQHVVKKRRFPVFISIAAVLTIIAGSLLYWRDSGGLQLAGITSPSGLDFSVGAVAAILAFLIGTGVTRPSVNRLGQLGQEIAAAGAPPTAAQREELERIDRRMSAAGRAIMALLTIAVVAMATARYLPS